MRNNNGYFDDGGHNYPFKIQYHFTDICNLRCNHCYDSGKKNKDESFGQIRTILDRVLPIIVKEWGRTVALSLTGGEPFASKHLFPLLSFLQEGYAERGLYVSILSNGTLIDKNTVKNIKSHFPIVRGVMVSLDGVSAETHEIIRGKGTHAKALRAWEILVQSGVRVSTQMVVSAQNYNEAYTLPEFANRFGLSALAVTRLVPLGRGRALGKSVITPTQVRNLYTKLNYDTDVLLSSSATLRITRYRCDWPVLFWPNEYRLTDLYYPFNKNGGACAVGRHAITIMSDGTVLACRRLPYALGNVLKDDFKDIWDHSFLWRIRLRHRYIVGKCERCEFMNDENLRFSCGGGGALCVTAGLHGDPFRPDPGCTYSPKGLS